ncbi:MAG TPA: c-type cytochrome [Steroidobacter sp.]
MKLMKWLLRDSTLFVALFGTMSITAVCVSADDAPDGGALYQVQEGNKVDESTLNGWRTWRALACERCHGAAQEGLVGPSLVESLKVLSKEDFHTVLMNGRPEKGMPPFNTSEMVNKNWEGLYAYLKGRSDGKIEPGRLSKIQ